MEGLTVIETPVMLELFKKIETMSQRIEIIAAELKEAKKPWLTTEDVMTMTGFGKTWINNNKQVIGYSTIGNCLRFKQADVEEFIEANYFKVKAKKRYF